MQDADTKEEDLITKDVENKTDGRIYEIGYLLVPTIPVENIQAVLSDIKDKIVSAGAVFISDDMPKEIRLAYTMQKAIQNIRYKFDTAYFGWVKFEAEPEAVVKIKKILDSSSEIIRFLTLKTVRENTMASKRFTPRDFKRKNVLVKEGVEGETPASINSVEIDKEIDAMVSV